MFPRIFRTHFYLHRILYSHPYWTHFPPYLILTVPFFSVQCTLGYGMYFFKWSYKLRHFVQNLPPVKKWYRKFNPTFLHWATRFFFKYYLAYLLKIFSPDFKGSLFYTVKHICFNIYRTRLPSVHRNMQSFSQPSPSSALVLWENCKSCIQMDNPFIAELLLKPITLKSLS